MGVGKFNNKIAEFLGLPFAMYNVVPECNFALHTKYERFYPIGLIRDSDTYFIRYIVYFCWLY